MKQSIFLFTMVFILLLSVCGCAESGNNTKILPKDIEKVLIFRRSMDFKEKNPLLLTIVNPEDMKIFAKMINHAKKIDGIFCFTGSSHIAEIHLRDKKINIDLYIDDIDKYEPRGHYTVPGHTGYHDIRIKDIKAFLQAYGETL